MRLMLAALLLSACALAPAAGNLLPTGDFEGDVGEAGTAQEVSRHWVCGIRDIHCEESGAGSYQDGTTDDPHAIR